MHEQKIEQRLRQIVREEIKLAFESSGITLNEVIKKGDTVDTPHGKGTVEAVSHPNVRVHLNTGATMRMNRNNVVVRN